MLKNIIKLMSGNGIGQLIQFLSIPVLMNFYTPEDFAMLALIIAISSVMVVISSLQLNVAIVTIKSNAGIKRVLKSGIYLNILMISVTTLIATFASALFYDASIRIDFVMSLVMLVFFTSVNYIFRGVLINKGLFGSLSKFLVARSVVVVFFQISLSQFDLFNGLVIGLILGEVLISILIPMSQLKYCISKCWVSRRRLLDIKVMTKTLRDFMYFGTMQEITSLLVLWSPFFALTLLYGERISGFYSVASRILWPATILVTSSISNVLFRQFETMHMGDIERMFIFSNKIKIIYIPLLACSYYVTPMVFSLILPPDWSTAADTSRYVALLCIFFLYILPFRVLFRVRREQKLLFMLEVCYLMVLLFYFSIFYVFYEVNVYFFLNGLVVLNLLLILMIEYISRSRMSLRI